MLSLQSLLNQVISKVMDQGCHRMILIAPGWPNMPWFWDLVNLSVPIPFQLPLQRDLVTQPFNGLVHRNLSNLNLHAWLLEPLPFRNKGSLTKWQKELRLLRDCQPEPCTSRSGPYLSNGVTHTRWTSGRPLSQIADFLLHLFKEKKLQPSTTEGYRTAITDMVDNDRLNANMKT